MRIKMVVPPFPTLLATPEELPLGIREQPPCHFVPLVPSLLPASAILYLIIAYNIEISCLSHGRFAIERYLINLIASYSRMLSSLQNIVESSFHSYVRWISGKVRTILLGVHGSR